LTDGQNDARPPLFVLNMESTLAMPYLRVDFILDETFATSQ
jgi:hypothetical protein